MRVSLNFSLLLLAILAPASACAGWFGPSSYAECMLKEVGNAGYSSARHDYADAYCRERFPCPTGQVRYDAASCGPPKPLDAYTQCTLRKSIFDWKECEPLLGQ